MGTKGLGATTTLLLFLLGGDKRDRTADLLHAMQALSQLSYTPKELRATPLKRGRIIMSAPDLVKQVQQKVL